MNESELIERTKNYGITHNQDGTTTIKMKLSVEGSINNCIYSQGEDNWGAKEIVRIYYEARRAWLQGDLETVADFFGVLV
jgi:hypothetical protein